MAATAAAIGFAPIAAAAPTATNTGGATVVQSPGNVQITASPGAVSTHAAWEEAGAYSPAWWPVGPGPDMQGPAMLGPTDGRGSSATLPHP
jgi:hypothetical protein